MIPEGLTVKQVIRLLKSVNPDRLVVLARDSEGNGYSPMIKAEIGRYVEDNAFSGKMHSESFDAGDRVVALYPTQ